MRNLIPYFKYLWLLAIALLPAAIFYNAHILNESYQCPPSASGECYFIAALTGQALQQLSIAAAILLWPACILYLRRAWLAKRST